MRCWCGSRRAVTSAGVNARPRLCRPLPPSSVRCRTASVAPLAPRSSVRASTVPLTSSACRRRSPTTAWTCCRPRTRSPALRWRCGISSAVPGRSRCGSCWAIGTVIPSCPTPRACSGKRRNRPWRLPSCHAAKVSGLLSSAGDRLVAATPAADAEHFAAAREGLGPDGVLLVDVGQIFIEDVARAAERLPALQAAGVLWLEEPFEASAYQAYAALAKIAGTVRLAGGEGAHNTHMARHLIDHGDVGFVQIDCGRIGGIAAAKWVADYASQRGVTFVNHTFTSHLALSASLQPYAGLAEHRLCEYPAAPKPLAQAFTANKLERDRSGEIRAPEAPGLGIDIDPAGVRQYLIDVEIKVAGKILYRTPAI